MCPSQTSSVLGTTDRVVRALAKLGVYRKQRYGLDKTRNELLSSLQDNFKKNTPVYAKKLKLSTITNAKFKIINESIDWIVNNAVNTLPLSEVYEAFQGHSFNRRALCNQATSWKIIMAGFRLLQTPPPALIPLF